MQLRLVSNRFELMSGSAVIMRRPAQLESGSFFTLEDQDLRLGESRTVDQVHVCNGIVDAPLRTPGLYSLLFSGLTIKVLGSSAVISDIVLLLRAIHVDAMAIASGTGTFRLAQTTLATISVLEEQAECSDLVVQTTLGDEATVDLIPKGGEVRILLEPGSHQFFLDRPYFKTADLTISAESPPLTQTIAFHDRPPPPDL